MLSKKIKRNAVKSFHRAKEDLINMSLFVFMLVDGTEERDQRSGSLHTAQGCKLSCCASSGQRTVPLGTPLNLSICLLTWP